MKFHWIEDDYLLDNYRLVDEDGVVLANLYYIEDFNAWKISCNHIDYYEYLTLNGAKKDDVRMAEEEAVKKIIDYCGYKANLYKRQADVFKNVIYYG